ncbi:MAG: hypothetical protein IT371_02620 [Deltaproteobacteria bacterium]|nr:hypothetical protein [Deltaproteobacteria bacterium]
MPTRCVLRSATRYRSAVALGILPWLLGLESLAVGRPPPPVPRVAPPIPRPPPRTGRALPSARPLPAQPGDPAPLVSEEYADAVVALAKGKLRVVRLRKGRLAKPEHLPRFVGRYQVRLYAEKTLRDLVRFNFPLTAPAGEPTLPNLDLNRSMARGVNAEATVRIPIVPGLTHLEILDSRTAARVSFSLKGIAPALPPLAPAVRKGAFGLEPTAPTPSKAPAPAGR